MNFKETDLPGLYIIEPKIYEDSRGYFFESYNGEDFRVQGLAIHFSG